MAIRHVLLAVGIMLATFPREALGTAVQGLVRIPDLELSSPKMVSVGPTVWIGAQEGAWRVQGTNVSRVFDESFDVQDLVSIDGVVWMGTSQGAWRLDGLHPTRVTEPSLDVTKISKGGGAVWFLTAKQGAWRLQDTTLQQVPKNERRITRIWEAGGGVWLGSNSNLWRVEGNDAKLVLSVDRGVKALETYGDAVWVAAASGLWRIQASHPVRVLERTLRTPMRIQEAGGLAWLQTRDDVWLLDGATVKSVLHLEKPLYGGYGGLKAAGGQAWFVDAENRAWVLGKAEAERFGDEAVLAWSVEEAGGATWIAVSGGALRKGGDGLVRISTPNETVLGVRKAAGAIWLLTDYGVWKVDGTKARRVLAATVKRDGFWEFGDEVWVASKKSELYTTAEVGLWRIHGDEVLKVTGEDLELLGAQETRDAVWFVGEKGAFKFGLK